jgi:S-adenosylmethionine:tRNA ribosyltransferase-isomerase
VKTSLFDFELPESLIADMPANPRDSARMLVVGKSREDKTISDLPQFLRAGDVMVFNDTRVIPARLVGKRGAAKVEVLLHKKCHPERSEGSLQSKDSSASPQNDKETWQCFAKPAKRLKIDDRLDFADDFSAEVIEKRDDGQVVLQFTAAHFHEKLWRYGLMPLPPYIEKKRHADSSDNAHYQTIYAKHEGSVAAPTAGLHFTKQLLAAIDRVGVKRAHVTLHVGGGTFLPVKTDDTNEHVMHSEYAVVTKETANAINAAKAAGGRIICVGTTSLRTLESAADENGMVQPMARETDIFITPGYRFKTADMLLTNFHLPKSTLFMLVCAFAGIERMKDTYAHAIRSNYHFYSYGDACLLYCHSEAQPKNLCKDPSLRSG